MGLYLLTLAGPRPFEDLFDEPPYKAPKPEPKDEDRNEEKAPEKG